MVAPVAAAFVALVAATAAGASVIPRTDGNSQCNTGSIQCCNSVQSTSSKDAGTLLDLLGLVVGPVDTLVGINCTPIPILGVAEGASCKQQPGSLISLGCAPIIL
ncbi:fungal hydrophobin [Pilatotrama ljubarskyi]|nr:fungal hydrophobin [Pilatotrama ljubarskyi]